MTTDFKDLVPERYGSVAAEERDALHREMQKTLLQDSTLSKTTRNHARPRTLFKVERNKYS